MKRITIYNYTKDTLWFYERDEDTIYISDDNDDVAIPVSPKEKITINLSSDINIYSIT